MYATKRLGFYYSQQRGFQPVCWYPHKNNELPVICVEPVYADGMKTPRLFVKLGSRWFLAPNIVLIVRRLMRRMILRIWPFVTTDDGHQYRVLHGPDRTGGVWVDDGSNEPLYLDWAEWK